MGQHKMVNAAGEHKDSINKRPNQESPKRDSNHVLCLVCHMPSAVFYDQKNGAPPVRLAKSMIRVMNRGKAMAGFTRAQRRRSGEMVYVHISPCLQELVHNWAKYVIQSESMIDRLYPADEANG